MRVVRILSSVTGTVLIVVSLASPLAAQDAGVQAAVIPEAGVVHPVAPRGVAVERPTLREASLRPATDAGDTQVALPNRSFDGARRPAALMPLYASLVALQGLDFHSTRRALDTGQAREANPAMRPFVKHDAAFLVLKGGATVGVIWASEKMWKRSPRAAVIVAGLVNAAMAAVVANNYRTVGR